MNKISLIDSCFDAILYNLESIELVADQGDYTLNIEKNISTRNTGVYGEVWLDAKLSVIVSKEESNSPLSNAEMFQLEEIKAKGDFIKLRVNEVEVDLTVVQYQKLINDIITYATW